MHLNDAAGRSGVVRLRFDDFHAHDGNVVNANNAQDTCTEHDCSKAVRTSGYPSVILLMRVFLQRDD